VSHPLGVRALVVQAAFDGRAPHGVVVPGDHGGPSVEHARTTQVVGRDDRFERAVLTAHGTPGEATDLTERAGVGKAVDALANRQST
jgi:hypothetical protein